MKKTPTMESNLQSLSCIGTNLYLTAVILVSPKYLFACNKTYLIQTHTWSNGNLRLKDTIWVIKISYVHQVSKKYVPSTTEHKRFCIL